MERKNLTESFVAKLPNASAASKRYEVYDAKIKELSCRVTDKGKKSFYIRKKSHGKAVRVCLGIYPIMSLEKARKAAYEMLNMLAENKNPNIEKKKLSKNLTIKELFDKYLNDYAKLNTKVRTYTENIGVYDRYLSKLENKIVSNVTRNDVEEFIIELYKKKGNYVANKALKLLRHMFNKGIEWGLDMVNPTLGIKKYPEKSRDRYLTSDEIANFFKAVYNYPDELARSYILISLFTGQRRSNVLSMNWQGIDFKNKTWHIRETKNGEPITVPLVEQVIEILLKLKENSFSEWVFPSKSSQSGHYEEPKRAFKSILKEAGIENFRIHDLRRTLGSYEAITGTSLHIIGKSLGHKSSQSTEIYARLSLDPIRAAAQMACNHMLELAKDNKEEEN